MQYNTLHHSQRNKPTNNSIVIVKERNTPMYQVLKRDGSVVNFDLAKIKNAMIQAFDACGKNYHVDIIDFLALKVTADF